jgi:hypothetical protein
MMLLHQHRQHRQLVSGTLSRSNRKIWPRRTVADGTDGLPEGTSVDLQILIILVPMRPSRAKRISTPNVC